MKIFVCEYLAGGGGAGSGGLLGEGVKMLAAVLADFSRLGVHEIATLLDARLPAESLVADQVDLVGPGDFGAAFRQRLGWAEAVLVIAPETDGILARLSAEVEGSGRLNLGSGSAAVAVTADKFLTGRLLAAAGIATPPVRMAGEIPGAWPYPLVLKPVDGCGSDGVYLVRNDGERRAAIERLGGCLEQPYVPGMAASVSLLAAGGRLQPISLNQQGITEADGQLRYGGGRLPLEHPLAKRAKSVAAEACRLVPGLQGYVGVDLVLDDWEVWVIEVNPRITTAYVGLRLVCPFNLAGALVDGAMHGVLPRGPYLAEGGVAW